MPTRVLRPLCATLLPLLLFAAPALALVPPGTNDGDAYVPPIQPASDEAQNALSGFQIPEGIESSLIAAEPDLANPVAFSIDEQGRFWVCETFRQGNAVTDNRDRGYWLLDDLAAQTVQDRLDYYKKHLGQEGLDAFSVHDDRIRLLTDTDSDGKVDEATVFADGFNNPEEGTGAGVLKVGKDVFYTNIPHLWRLRDTNGDGVADEREAVFSGFGVRTAFRGHDMHGLIMGPDGRLYFSIGDRGFNVINQEGERLKMPGTGAVFRCELDGSNLEVFAYGLRNPQELAFDNFGNLFTGDNNSDSGDKARWVHVVEGSDSGWRMYYQYLDDRGPWNREMMWLPRDTQPFDYEAASGLPTGIAAKDIQPAYILPPVANFADGPSGLVHYPGVGLSEKYNNHFFLCDFRGTPGNSGLRSFTVKPKGAGFELADSQEFIWRMLCTDVAFAPDGTLVLSDWVNGWNGEGKGRLYGFTDPAQEKAGQESARLLAEDFSGRSAEELVGLFNHADQRVRQKAQFAFVEKPLPDWYGPGDAFRKLQERIPALHLVWALGQKARGGEHSAFTLLLESAGHDDEIVRAQIIRMVGDALAMPAIQDSEMTEGGKVIATARCAEALHDPSPAVRLQGAIALGKARRWDGELPEPSTFFVKDDHTTLFYLNDIPKLLFNMIANGGDDPVIRSAAAAALANFGDQESLVAAKQHNSHKVRTVAVVALRRLKSEKIAAFLSDANPNVVAEAARAINDVPIDGATAQLAALAGQENLNDPTLRRVLNANFRSGTKENAEAVANIAANPETSTKLRVEAIEELKLWNDPPKTDRVTGMYRPVEPRQADFLADVVRPRIAELLAAQEAEVRTAAIDLVVKYQLDDAAPVLRAIATDSQRGDDERVLALKAFSSFEGDGLKEMLAAAVEDPSAAVRSAALSLWAKFDPVAAVPLLEETVREGTLIEQQAAIETLAELKLPAADAVLGEWLDKLERDEVPAGIQLELLEAAGKREATKSQAAAYEAARAGEPMKAYAVALEGGDFERGKDIFFNRASVSCQRCHKADGGQGGEVGPDLSQIAEKQDRRYLLEALVDPNAKIAENFESVVVVTSEGLVVTGVKRAEDEDSLTLITAEAKTITIPKNQIEERAVGQSAMPEDLLKHLSKRDVRDLVEFLAGQGEG